MASMSHSQGGVLETLLLSPRGLHGHIVRMSLIRVHDTCDCRRAATWRTIGSVFPGGNSIYRFLCSETPVHVSAHSAYARMCPTAVFVAGR